MRVREASEAGDERTDTAPTLGTRADAPFDPDAYRATLPDGAADALATLCRRRVTLLRTPPSDRKGRRRGWDQRFMGELEPEENAARDLLRAFARLPDGPGYLERPDVLERALRRMARGGKGITSPAHSMAVALARLCRFVVADAEKGKPKRSRRQCGEEPGQFTPEEAADLRARFAAMDARPLDAMAW